MKNANKLIEVSKQRSERELNGEQNNTKVRSHCIFAIWSKEIEATKNHLLKSLFFLYSIL